MFETAFVVFTRLKSLLVQPDGNSCTRECLTDLNGDVKVIAGVADEHAAARHVIRLPLQKVRAIDSSAIRLPPPSGQLLNELDGRSINDPCGVNGLVEEEDHRFAELSAMISEIVSLLPVGKPLATGGSQEESDDPVFRRGSQQKQVAAGNQPEEIFQRIAAFDEAADKLHVVFFPDGEVRKSVVVPENVIHQRSTKRAGQVTWR